MKWNERIMDPLLDCRGFSRSKNKCIKFSWGHALCPATDPLLLQLPPQILTNNSLMLMQLVDPVKSCFTLFHHHHFFFLLSLLLVIFIVESLSKHTSWGSATLIQCYSILFISSIGGRRRTAKLLSLDP